MATPFMEKNEQHRGMLTLEKLSWYEATLARRFDRRTIRNASGPGRAGLLNGHYIFLLLSLAYAMRCTGHLNTFIERTLFDFANFFLQVASFKLASANHQDLL